MAHPVSLARCGSYHRSHVEEALQKALEDLGGISAFVSPGQRVLLKPNLLLAKPPEAAVTTHPEIVRAVAIEVLRAGGKVFLGDSPGFGAMASVLSKTGIGRVVKELEIVVVPFRSSRPVKTPENSVFKVLDLAGEALDFDAVVNLPKLKTHAQMTLTLAVKNLFGTVVGMEKPLWHLRAGDPLRFADLHLDISLAVRPVLNVLDGVLAMEGNGPSAGNPRWVGLIAASPSALALDMVIASLVGVDSDRFPLLHQARKRKMTEADPEEVEVLGLTRREAAVDRFLLPEAVKKIGFSIPSSFGGSLRRSLTAFPVIDPARCTSCGVCRDSCPVSAITLSSGGGGMVDRAGCISCFCCQELCPDGAIRPVSGVLLRLMKRLGAA